MKAKVHADKNLLTLFEAELDNFVGSKSVDNTVAACPRLVNGGMHRVLPTIAVLPNTRAAK